MTDDEAPSAEAIASALGIGEGTLLGCLSQQPELTLAHLVAFGEVDPDAVDADLRDEFEAWFHGVAWREFVVEHSRSGYLIDIGGEHAERLKLLRCPACGESFTAKWATRDCPLRRHLASEHGPADFRSRQRRPTASDVLYTRRASAYGRDGEGTQKHNRLREEPNTRRPPFRVRPAGNRCLRVSLYQVLRKAPTKSLRSPSSGACTPSGATSSRRRASNAPK